MINMCRVSGLQTLFSGGIGVSGTLRTQNWQKRHFADRTAVRKFHSYGVALPLKGFKTCVANPPRGENASQTV
jgi:hypothetical protein